MDMDNSKGWLKLNSTWGISTFHSGIRSQILIMIDHSARNIELYVKINHFFFLFPFDKIERLKRGRRWIRILLEFSTLPRLTRIWRLLSHQPFFVHRMSNIIKSYRIANLARNGVHYPRYHSRFSDHTFLKGSPHICVANCALSLHIFVCRCSVFSLVTPRCRRDQKISGPSNSIKPAHYHSSRIRGAMTNSPQHLYPCRYFRI